MAKNASYLRSCMKRLEQYKRRESLAVKKSVSPTYSYFPKKEPEASVLSDAILELQKPIVENRKKKPYGQRMLRDCVCGKPMGYHQKLCSDCNKQAKPNATTEGVRFVPPIYAIKLEKKTGIKCGREGCETLTERWDGLCLTHSDAVSKSKKYKTNVPKARPQVLPSLDEFKAKLTRS